MRSFADLIMRNRLVAILVVAFATVLPLLSWVGGAAFALVTLRKGALEGLLVALGATALLGVQFAFSIGDPRAALMVAVQLWLPLFLVSLWLRATISLASAIQVAALLGVAVVVGVHLLLPNPAAYWKEVLEPARQLAAQSGPDAAGAWKNFEATLLPVMTGLWVLNMLSLVLSSLLVGRWWQAMLYNPGGFKEEFHALRFDYRFALLAAVLLIASVVRGPGLIYDAALVMGSIFVLETLAVAHRLVATGFWNRAWLVAVYVLCLLLFRIMMAVGIIDAFVDIRRRLAQRSGPSGPG